MSEHGTPPANPYQGQPYPAEPAQAPVPPAPAKSGVGKKIASILGVIVIALVVIGLKVGVKSLFNDDDKTAEAKAGDCIAQLPEVKEGEQKDAPDAKVVKCDAADAAYDVVGRFDGVTEAQAKEAKECEQYMKEGVDLYTYSAVAPGKKGYLLCLVPHKKG